MTLVIIKLNCQIWESNIDQSFVLFSCLSYAEHWTIESGGLQRKKPFLHFHNILQVYEGTKFVKQVNIIGGKIG